jgi:glutamate racemase
MKLGVFDSGIGGLSVAKALQQAFPHAEILFKNDSAHVPYGVRKPQELLQLVLPILESLVIDGCDVIVIACNTVSTTLINDLRNVITVPLVAMEPMVKPASAMTNSRVIAVCATPTTLASQRYKWLKEMYAADVTVIEPDCRDWSGMIERNEIDETLIASEIYDVLNRGADVIVLGCTHYHWIEEEIQNLVQGQAVVIQPEPAIIRQVERLLLDL